MHYTALNSTIGIILMFVYCGVNGAVIYSPEYCTLTFYKTIVLFLCDSIHYHRGLTSEFVEGEGTEPVLLKAMFPETSLL